MSTIFINGVTDESVTKLVQNFTRNIEESFMRSVQGYNAYRVKFSETPYFRVISENDPIP